MMKRENTDSSTLLPIQEASAEVLDAAGMSFYRHCLQQAYYVDSKIRVVLPSIYRLSQAPKSLCEGKSGGWLSHFLSCKCFFN